MTEATPSTWINHRAIVAAFTSKASPTARHVLLAIARHCGGDDLGAARPSLRRLVELTGRTTKTVVAAVEELVRIGELEVVRHGGEGKRGGRGGAGHANRYRLLIQPPSSVLEEGNHATLSTQNSGATTLLFAPETVELLPETVEWLPANSGATTPGELRENTGEGGGSHAPTSPALKKCSSRIPKPKTGDSLAVAAYREAADRQRCKLLTAHAELIDRTVKASEVVRWRGVVVEWVERGFKRDNVKGMVDVFVNGWRENSRGDSRRSGQTPPAKRHDDPAPDPSTTATLPGLSLDPPAGIARSSWKTAGALVGGYLKRQPLGQGQRPHALAVALVEHARATPPGDEPGGLAALTALAADNPKTFDALVATMLAGKVGDALKPTGTC